VKAPTPEEGGRFLDWHLDRMLDGRLLYDHGRLRALFSPPRKALCGLGDPPLCRLLNVTVMGPSGGPKAL
jgi:hypothetical protein